MMSPEIDQLAAALAAAQAEFSAVPKNSINPFFKSNYAALPDVVASASPVLAKHGLAISQFIDAEFLGIDGLITYLIHSSGQFISHTMKLHLPKDDPQGQGSAVTYARRYAYMSVLGLVADEDDDGNRASAPAPARPQSAPKPVAKAIGGEPPEVQDIIAAALIAPDDEFLTSLANQWQTKGSLSEKQLAAGKKRAYVVMKNSAPKATVAETLATEFGATEEEPF
jgi:hypothetical protein